MSTPQFDLVGIVVGDMPRSLAFYRQLGLDLPTDADAQPHVEVTLPGGTRIVWDTLETIRSFDPDHQPPSGNSSVGRRSDWTTPPTSMRPTRSWSAPATTATRRRGTRSGASATP